MTTGKRLFVGLRVSLAASNALAGCAETLARRARDAGVDIRWMSPASYHLTIKYLGWTREEAIPAVRDRLASAAAGTPRLTLEIARLGAFPSRERASVVWAGVSEPSGALEQLAARVEATCVELGFRAERRGFHPHITMGRLRDPRAIQDVLLPLSEQMFGRSKIDVMTLFESETKPSGSVYSEVSRILFKTASEGVIPVVDRQTPALELDPSRPPREPETDDGWPRGHHHDDL
jgi:RNA 2',3'-cyclic 3'-phosphodiesterase